MKKSNLGTTTIKVSKNIVGEYASELEKKLSEKIKEATESFVLDLGNISVIDSRGIALCIGLLKECEKKNISLLIELSPDLFKFFKIFKLDKILPIKEKEISDGNTG
ncbi:MAG: STAS domain-containing protein [Chitinispirillaceae bacterium]|nr:STAS domain-containing protein [Chitinispirillaceae bacterium]